MSGMERRAENDAPALCGKRLSTRPYWMSEWQYDPCDCLLPKRHEGECACRCDMNEAGVTPPGGSDA